MRQVFDETRINGMTLANRLVRSATWEGMCEEDGRPMPKLAVCYANLAKGGIGLIITGYTFVRPDGKQFPGQMGIYTDDFAGEMQALTRAVQEKGERSAFSSSIEVDRLRLKPPAAGRLPLPLWKRSSIPELPAELSAADIEALVHRFGEGAARAREYGFDAVQLHAAHGYLINQFLSPLTNRRTDGYGGSMENRSRFLLEVFRSVRKAVGKDFPVLVKLNGSDNLEGGLDIDAAQFAARVLDEEGVDAIEVSGGTPASGDRTPVRQGIATREQEAYNLPLAARIKGAVSCPVMVIGGFRTFEVVGGVIRRGEADYVSLARPLIREPHLPRRWEEGNEAKARCISCNGCFKPGLKEGGIYCVVDRIERESRGTSL